MTPFERPVVCVAISRSLVPTVLSYYSSQRAEKDIGQFKILGSGPSISLFFFKFQCPM